MPSFIKEIDYVSGGGNQDLLTISLMREDLIEIVSLLDILRREMMVQALGAYEDGSAKRGDELSEIAQRAKCYARNLAIVG